MKGRYKIKRRGRPKRKFKPLTKEETKLVKDNLDLIEYPVYSALLNIDWNTGCYTKQDLDQVAFFAMCVAAKDYDKSKDTSYRTYAQSKIHGYITHALRDKSRMTTINRKVLQLRKDVKALLDEGLTFQEIANELDISTTDVYLCDISWRDSWASFDYESEKGLSLSPIYVDVDSWECDPRLFNKLKNLNDEHKELLLNFFNNDLSHSVLH